MGFIWQCSNDNGEWIDHIFMDCSPKRDLRQWRLSVNTRTGEQYACLQRAEDDEAGFDFDVTLPRKFIKLLGEAM